ncbi:MAG TPA: VOC family protein [Mycobacteriales bacterium]|nr:VOC family protein [Mycobacteriales bacterium]
MADVSFKDLCVDAVRPEVVGEFWARVLGLQLELQDNGNARLSGATPQHGVWVCGVPEAQDVKNRVHLDVRFEDPTVVLGATAVREPSGEDHWRVLADPDGLLFCAMGPREGAPPGPYELVVDSADPEAIGSWWAQRYGVDLCREEGTPWVWLEGVPGSPYQYWVFNPVPERKTVKNRVHWDVLLQDSSVEDLVAAGATVLRGPDEENEWTVLADPEGNEFCAFTSDPADD